MLDGLLMNQFANDVSIDFAQNFLKSGHGGRQRMLSFVLMMRERSNVFVVGGVVVSKNKVTAGSHVMVAVMRSNDAPTTNANMFEDGQPRSIQKCDEALVIARRRTGVNRIRF